MSNTEFWMWTLFVALLSFLFVKILCYSSCYNSSDRLYYINSVQRHIPLNTYKVSYVNKIGNEKV